MKDYIRKDHIDKELVLFKIAVDSKIKRKVLAIIKKSSAKVVKSSADTITAEITGTQEDIDKLLGALNDKGFGIKEMVRTGRIAMEL